MRNGVRQSLIVILACCFVLVGFQSAPATAQVSSFSIWERRCHPKIAPVYAGNSTAAACLAAKLDRWAAVGGMGVGQQLRVSREDFLSPLRKLKPGKVAVVGFDLRELADAQAAGKDPIPDLIQLGREGYVLTATWHARNPATRGYQSDRTWTDLPALLNFGQPISNTFFADWDAAIKQLLRLQAAGVPVILYPLHEAAGDWFWWGLPDPVVYKKLFATLQERASYRGLHSVLWGHAAAPKTREPELDPVTLIPDKIDIAGIDTYDYETNDPQDRVKLVDYARIQALVPRMALTEVGPLQSDGSWNPQVINDTLNAAHLYANYALLWTDDGVPGDGVAGVKQISSLQGGRQWLATCPGGVCKLTG